MLMLVSGARARPDFCPPGLFFSHPPPLKLPDIAHFQKKISSFYILMGGNFQ